MVSFSDGLVFVSVPSGSGVQVTGYREATGTKVWSRSMPSPPVPGGNLLFVTTCPAPGAGACPSAIGRIDALTGRRVWTSHLPAGACSVTASDSYVVCGTTILNATNGATLLVLPASSQAWAFKNSILVQDGSVLTLNKLRGGRLHPLWRRNIDGYTVLSASADQLALSQIVIIRGSTGVLPGKVALVNPVTGAIGRPVMAAQVTDTPQGLDVLSPAGRLIAVSTSGTRAGPRSPGLQYSGGILWNYLSPNGYSTGPVYAYARTPGSFQSLGRLVTTRSQVSVEGNDSLVVSDGRYAAIVAAPVIYLFKV